MDSHGLAADGHGGGVGGNAGGIVADHGQVALINFGSNNMTVLARDDSTAAQVGFIRGELIVTAKNNAVEDVKLDRRGALTGAASMAAGIPANVDTTIGRVTRGIEVQVKITHREEITIVCDGTVLTTAPR